MADISKEELKAVLEGLLSEARRDLEPHPSPDELVAYDAGELPAAEETRIQNHLALCPHCLELLLDLGRLSDSGSDGEASIPAGEKAAAWQALQPRLAVEGAPPGRARPAFSLASPRPAYALAACLFLAVVGLSLRVVHLERGMADLSHPQVNAPVVDLFPASPLRGDQQEPAVVKLAPASRFFVLILSPKGSADYAGYRVEILDAGGKAVWSQEGLEKNPQGSFTLILAQSFLGPGEYRLRLYGLAGGTGRVIEEFRVQIVR
ncbi:MAG TPA: zf-HC2 domain-containing protein [Thermoanaerobaculia bacterium]|nr:zf-HC2 domain-containing protein [Thermoanaerobaculia bacterium]